MKTLYLKAFGKIVMILLFAAAIQNAAAANLGATWVSNNATLTSLKVSPVTTLTVVLGPNYRDYTTTVPNTETSVKITPTAQDAAATIKVNGVTVASGAASVAIPLNVGDNVINTVVTAEDGTTVKTYSIKFVRLGTPVSKNALLTSLTVTPATTLATVSGPDYKDYTATVPYYELTVKIIPTAQSATATIKVNGVTVASGAASAAIPLNEGDNVINTAVTAEDGVTVKTYSIKFIRLPSSSDASLSNLTTSAGTLSPVFAAGTPDYGATVSNATNSVTITPTANNAAATIKVNSITVASGTAPAALPLGVGNNWYSIAVTAADGTTAKFYTVNFKRLPSSNAGLAGLTLSSGTLSPVFATGTINYTASVSNATASITVTPASSDATATIKINGATVASGSASAALPLVVGQNVISTAVTAEDGVTTKTYSLKVTRLSSPTSANLAGLTISSGTLSPVFATETTSYTALVSNATASVTVTPVTSYATATIKVKGATVASGSASAALPLKVGENIINTDVTGEDGTVKTYVIKFIRLAIPSHANLSNLTISSGTLTPGFAAGTFNYTASVSNGTTSVTITPATGNAGATVKINGATVASGNASAAIPLYVGDNVINTVVTAEDGITVKTYSITFTRLASPSDAGLSHLTLSSGTLTPGFAPGTTTYSTTVDNATASVIITPVTSNAAATVKVNGTTVTSGSASAPIPLNVGDNVINTVVTAGDGTTVKTYSINFTRLAASNANLAGLAISSGTLSPVFATETTGYTASVSNAIYLLTVTPTATEAGASIKVNGIAVASGSPSKAFVLSVDTNIITVVVTAKNGVNTKTYTLAVTRISTDALLKSIAVNPSSPLGKITGNNYADYITDVPNSQSSVTIIPKAWNNGASIKVNGVTVITETASPAIHLNVGFNKINIVVTAQDGVTKKSYSITFVRAPVPNANLAGFIISSGTLSPVFSSNITSYTASVTSPTIKITPTAQNPNVVISVNGFLVNSGQRSEAIVLADGRNVITTEVSDYSYPYRPYTKIYTLTVTRISSNAHLDSLKVAPETTLNFVGSGIGSLNYTGEVPYSVSTVKIIPTAQSTKATIKVNGVTVPSGTASPAIPLNVGDNNVINTVVTAEDGVTVITYSIKFTRQPPAGAALSYAAKAGPVLDSAPKVHQNISPNGDGNGDVLVIEGITAYPENKLQIMSHSGTLVYEAKGYDNATKVFDGHSSTNGKLQRAGTYFYSLEYKDGNETKHKTGFIVLKY